ncbi:MAG: putative arrestin domain-containing protein 3 [Candidatus Bathyarchaeota archaeon B24]|nr:MAG: putative arrestin domain-containing protein 3 [Candidatus Bathyarchaeota archaeon B24]
MLFGPKVKLELDTDRDSYFPGEDIEADLSIKTNKKFDFQELRLELLCQSALRWNVVRRYSLYSSGGEDEDPDEMVHETFTFKLMELKETLSGKGQIPKSGANVSGRIRIPEDAPPTYQGGWIKTGWTLKAVIGRRMRRDIVAKKQITVLSRMEVEKPVGEVETFVEMGEFSAYVRLPKATFTPGETLEGEAVINSKKMFKVDELRIDLVNRGEITPEKVLGQFISSSTDFSGTDVYRSPAKVLEKDLELVPGTEYKVPFSYKVPNVHRPSCKTEYYESKWLLRIILGRKHALDRIIATPIVIVDDVR